VVGYPIWSEKIYSNHLWQDTFQINRKGHVEKWNNVLATATSSHNLPVEHELVNLVNAMHRRWF